MRSLFTHLVAVFLILGSFAVLVYAAAPDVMKLDARQGIVTFTHGKHSQMPGITCKTCHHEMKGDTVEKKCSDCHKRTIQNDVPTIKDAAHKQCRGCHKTMKKGPTNKCKECHVKVKK